MLRYFEVRGLEEPHEHPENFGFVSTNEGRVFEIDGEQLFSSWEDFEDYLSTSGFEDGLKERLKGLVPTYLREVIPGCLCGCERRKASRPPLDPLENK